MFRVKNLINQSLSVGERTLPIDEVMSVRAIDDELRRLEARGYVAISEPTDADEARAKAAADKAAAEAAQAEADAEAARLEAERLAAEAEARTASETQTGGKKNK